MEVLKRYKSNRVREPRSVYTCYGINTDGDAICEVERHDGEKIAKLVEKQEFKFFTEYKEPRKGTVWVNVYIDSKDKIHHVSHESRYLANVSANSCTFKRIACIEVPWVEGQGLENKCACLNKQRCEC